VYTYYTVSVQLLRLPPLPLPLITRYVVSHSSHCSVCRYYILYTILFVYIYYKISILPRCGVFFRSLTVTIMVWWSTTVDDSEMCNCTFRVYTCSSVYTINTTNTMICVCNSIKYFLIFAPLRTRNQYARHIK